MPDPEAAPATTTEGPTAPGNTTYTGEYRGPVQFSSGNQTVLSNVGNSKIDFKPEINVGGAVEAAPARQIEVVEAATEPVEPSPPTEPELTPNNNEELQQRIANLEAQVAQLTEAIQNFINNPPTPP